MNHLNIKLIHLYQFMNSILRSASSKFFLGYLRTQLFAPRTNRFFFSAISLSSSKERHNMYSEGMKKAQTPRKAGSEVCACWWHRANHTITGNLGTLTMHSTEAESLGKRSLKARRLGLGTSIRKKLLLLVLTHTGQLYKNTHMFTHCQHSPLD